MSIMLMPNEILLEIAEQLSLSDQRSLLCCNKHLAKLLPHVLINKLFQKRNSDTCQRCLLTLASQQAIGTINILLERGILQFIDNSSYLLKVALMEPNDPHIRYAIIHTLLKVGFRADICDPSGWTPLVYAISEQMEDIVHLLLSMPENCACVNGPPMQVQTPLIAAIKAGRVDIVRLLLKNNNLLVNLRGPSGYTALEMAISLRSMRILNLLLNDSRVDISSANGHITTPLMDAIRRNHIQVVQLFLKNRRLDINASTLDGHTALHETIHSNDPACTMLRMILNISSLNVNPICHCGNTPLHTAVLINREAVEILLRDGRTDINARSFDRGTALHIAVKVRNKDIVSMLLQDPRINIGIRDYDGKTAMEYGANNRSIEIGRILLADAYRRHSMH
ncbi:ankyrin repeat-containing domain protein [Tuber indicum]|nr:ankyrin repeat-containing domain protein [Tuber indicum]